MGTTEAYKLEVIESTNRDSAKNFFLNWKANL